MKKARAWLDVHGVTYAFHDYKVEGVERGRLEEWVRAVGWETLLNRAGTTFRKLPDADKTDLGERKAVELMLAHPSMIKRPVVETARRADRRFQARDLRKDVRTMTRWQLAHGRASRPRRESRC